jgi:hypothetical protein
MRHAKPGKSNLRNTGRTKLNLNGRKRLKPQRNRNLERSRDPQPGELAARLDRLADVRQSVVNRGKMLIANPEYPNPKTIRAVAGLLAKHL